MAQITTRKVGYGWTIIGSVVIIVIMAHAFVKGGISGVDRFTQWFVLSLPFSVFLTSYYTVRVHSIRIATRAREWGYSVAVIVFFVCMLILGLYETTAGENFQSIYMNTSVVGTGGLFAVTTFAGISVWFRVFRRASWRSLLMVFCLTIGLLHSCPLGGMIWPGINDIGTFLSASPTSAGNAAFEIGCFLGLLAMISRVFIGRETMTPETRAG